MKSTPIQSESTNALPDERAHASREPGAPGRRRAGNNGWQYDESGCEVVRASSTFKGRHRSDAARAEAPLRQVATPRNSLRGRFVDQPVLSNRGIPLSVQEDRTSRPLGARNSDSASDLLHARPKPACKAVFRQLLMLLVLPAAALAHDPAASPPPDQERLIRFPDVEAYHTLVVDLHTHSVFSDGHVWPKIRVEEALRDGLDALAITEHLEWQPHRADIPHPDRNRAYDDAVAAAAGHDLLIIRGSEITREAPAGHMNAVFIEDANALLRLEEEPKSETPTDYYIAANQWPPEAAVKAANDQGAFVFWNHAWWSRTNPLAIASVTDFQKDMIDAGMLHGIEIANGDHYAEEAFQIALDHGLTPLGVSDIHDLIDWDYRPDLGGHRPVTLAFATERSTEALREALFDGRTVVWFKDLLIGREAQVVGLLKAALDVTEGRYEPGLQVGRIRIANDSDAPIRLRNLSGYTFPEHGDQLEVPPHGSIRLIVRPGALLEELELDFEVQNALIAPKTRPRLRHRVRMEIPPAPAP